MLRPDLTSWRSQLERLERSHAKVCGTYGSSVAYQDDLFHYMQDCLHLKDWIRNDRSTGVGKAIESEFDKYKALRIAADLANGAKHLERHTNREGAYITKFGVTVHLAQEKPVDVLCEVTLGDGTTIRIESVVQEAFENWTTILGSLGLLRT